MTQRSFLGRKGREKGREEKKEKKAKRVVGLYNAIFILEYYTKDYVLVTTTYYGYTNRTYKCTY